MMKIVVDAREYSTSTGRYVERLLHYLQLIDKQHDYVVLLKPQDVQRWEAINPRFTIVVCPYKEFTFGEQLGFKRQIEKQHADLVHFPMAQQPLLYRGKTLTAILDLTTLRFRNPSKNPIAFTAKQQIYKVLIKVVSRKSTRIITISEYVKKDLIKFTKIQENKIDVVYPAADELVENSELMPSISGKKFILYVGRSLPHKNLARLLESFKIVHEKQKDLFIVFVGKFDANYERLRDYSKKIGVERSVIFTDFVTDGRLKWLYENTSAYVFPSLSEGFGLPGLEAMVHGAPVVSSKATCLPEIYGDAAHYFDPNDPDDIATKILEVISDEKLRQALIAKGAAQAANYSWQHMAEQTLAIYNQILKS